MKEKKKKDERKKRRKRLPVDMGGGPLTAPFQDLADLRNFLKILIFNLIKKTF